MLHTLGERGAASLHSPARIVGGLMWPGKPGPRAGFVSLRTVPPRVGLPAPRKLVGISPRWAHHHAQHLSAPQRRLRWKLHRRSTQTPWKKTIPTPPRHHPTTTALPDPTKTKIPNSSQPSPWGPPLWSAAQTQTTCETLGGLWRPACKQPLPAVPDSAKRPRTARRRPDRTARLPDCHKAQATKNCRTPPAQRSPVWPLAPQLAAG